MLTLLISDAGFRSTPCLPMHWLLKSPVHGQAWHWLCRKCNMSCCSKVNLVYLCQAKSKICFKMLIYLLKALIEFIMLRVNWGIYLKCITTVLLCSSALKGKCDNFDDICIIGCMKVFFVITVLCTVGNIKYHNIWFYFCQSFWHS